MGNSNSQFKRNRSQYGSTRSVAFSLPSAWDRHGFAYSDSIGTHQPSNIKSSAELRPPKPILRNSSNASSSKAFSYRNGLGSSKPNLSRSLYSLPDSSQYERERLRSLPRKSSVGSLPLIGPLTPKQYSDIYLKNDLRKVFRAQDRSSSVAQLDEINGTGISDSTASLDRKLRALKSQRHYSLTDLCTKQQAEEPRREGATEKRIKSRKSKKAPQPNPHMLGPNYNDYKPVYRPEGMYRKKANAPQPPLRGKAHSLSSLAVGYDDKLQNTNSLSQQSLFQEIEAELAKHNIPISPTKEEVIQIPKPDYNSQQSSPQGHAYIPVKSVLSKSSSSTTKIKPQAPSTPVKVATVNQDKKPSVVISSETQNEISSFNSRNIVIADIEVHSEPAANTKPEPRNANAPMVKPKPKKEVREIAIQYDAPVEIAIQCDGHTLKEKPRRERTGSNASSLTELLQMFNEAIQSGRADLQKSENNCSTDTIDSRRSDSSSSRSRNSAQQKIVPLHEVLAGVPEPPPLPNFGVKLIQKRTIRDNAPISMAPSDIPHSCSLQEDAETNPRSFSVFQQELLKAYEKIDKKRKNNPTHTKLATANRKDSVSSEANALKVFRHASTIMGVETPHENESDSGHDEPSDSLSQGDRTPSIPDFVLDGIAKSLHNNTDYGCDYSSPKSSTKGDKSKFNSIKRLKKSVQQLLSSKTRSDEIPSHSDSNDSPLSYSDENWTLSGRSKSTRTPVTQPDVFSSVNTHKVHSSSTKSNGTKATDNQHGKASSPANDFLQSCPPFKSTNMKSFSLLTPLAYPRAAAKAPPSPASKSSYKRNSGQLREDSLADVPL